jgi:midasin (ATPase involved in ribosome maturation)
MAKVEIVNSLFQEIQKKFKGESHKIIDLLETLEENPHKGKLLGRVGGIIIKELRYKSFRFYFITDGYILKIMDESKLVDLLIRFVRMSDKKDQQQTINEIKKILINFGSEGFNK